MARTTAAALGGDTLHGLSPKKVEIVDRLIKAAWALVVALAAATSVVFWAGYNWSELNVQIKKIEALQKVLTYQRTLGETYTVTAKIGYNSTLAHCSSGDVITKVRIGGENVELTCARLLPTDLK